MSASLVGSEMCIRDRHDPWEAAPVGLEGSLESPGPLPVEESPPAQPVSYTHLTLPTICSV
eukprot:6464902-Alexandrium_andersonii.AAC.1